MSSKSLFSIILATLLTALISHGALAAEPERLVLGFVPTENAERLAETAKPLADELSKELDIPVEAFVSAQYIGLAEAMGARKVDIGFLNSFNYVLAKDLFDVEVILKTVRRGRGSYRSQFVTRSDTGIDSVRDLRGKRLAFVDPVSTSGYLFPAAYMMEQNVDPDTDLDRFIFAGSHDNALLALYRGEVDAAVSFEDARPRIQREYPDVMERLVVFEYTEWIPNDTVSLRAGLDDQLKERITAAFLSIAQTPEGRAALEAIHVDGFTPAGDAEYDVIRRTAKAMDLDLGW